MLEFMASDSSRDMLDDFDALSRGRISKRVLGAGGDESISDPTRVPPAGACSMASRSRPTISRTAAPCALGRDPRGDGRPQPAALSEVRAEPDRENIVKRSIVTPLDHARNMPEQHAAAAMCTAWRRTSIRPSGHRPTPDLAQYTVPGVERLYLVGPFMHPGGGVYGAGRATAIRCSMI